jgi:hypothetical protein
MRLACAAVFVFLAACAAQRDAPRVAAATTQAAPRPEMFEPPPAAPAAPKLPPVTVQLYVMSQCPFGVQAENSFAAAIDHLGDAIDLQVDFIGERGADGTLISMHGPREVRADMVQACAQHLSPRWFELIRCQNRNTREIDTNWETCAADLHMPVDRIRACAEGQLGERLLGASFERTRLKGTRSSPTIYIAGHEYEGGRKPVELMRAVCSAYGDEKPSACDDIPVPPRVNVTILSDKRCAECEPRQLRAGVARIVATPVFRELDYGDAEGKQLFGEIGPAKLPAVIFDASLAADQEAAEQLRRSLDRRNGHLVADAGDWSPQCHDDGGCKLDECKDELVCRKEAPKKLDVFIMSQCPYAVKGMNAMKEVLEHFDKHGTKIDFAVHFIGKGDAANLLSMHGQDEVDEDVREACVFKHYGKTRAFFKYVWCRNRNIKDTDWRTCTGKDTAVDAKLLEKCSEQTDEGKKLLEKSFAESEAIGFGASPTWLTNDKFRFSAIDAETIKANFCAHNPKLPGCDKNFDGTPATARPTVTPPPAANDPPTPGCGN